MRLPNFVAEASVYRGGHYVTMPFATVAGVVPQRQMIEANACSSSQIAGGYEDVDGECILTGWNWGGNGGGSGPWIDGCRDPLCFREPRPRPPRRQCIRVCKPTPAGLDCDHFRCILISDDGPDPGDT